MLDHLDDLAADFLAIYRKEIVPEDDEWADLSGPRFFSLAFRVAAYRGVMYCHVGDQERARQSQTGPATGSSGIREVSLEQLMEDDPSLIERG